MSDPHSKLAQHSSLIRNFMSNHPTISQLEGRDLGEPSRTALYRSRRGRDRAGSSIKHLHIFLIPDIKSNITWGPTRSTPLISLQTLARLSHKLRSESVKSASERVRGAVWRTTVCRNTRRSPRKSRIRYDVLCTVAVDGL